jgi:DNA-binding LacI/PurR family transcriptional regulator
MSNRITITDVAKAANVSISSVSRYMNGKQLRPYVYERVKEAVEKMDYKENYFAKSLRQKKPTTICVLINLFSEQFQAFFLDQMNIICNRCGVELIVISCGHYDISLAEHFNFLQARMVDGIILFTEKLGDEEIEMINFMSESIPVVLVDSMSPKLKVSAVLLDNFTSSFNATQYLIDNGHRNIGVITGNIDQMLSFKERLAGFRHAMTYNGIEIDEGNIGYTEINHQKDAYNSTIKIMSHPNPPTAIFAHTYHMTFGVIMALRDLKRSIPDDVSIIGYDYYSIANSIAPNVTCVDQPLLELAKTSFDILLAQIKAGKSIGSLDVHRIPANFIENKSVKDISPSALRMRVYQ